MARLKKGNWTPKEVKELRKVKKNGKHKEKLEILASTFNRSYETTYQKWYSEVNKAEKPDNEDDVMVFEIDTTIPEPTRMNMDELKRMQRGLAQVIPTLGVRKGNIPIPNKLASQARKYLDSTFPESKFVFSAVKEKGENTGVTRIFKVQ